MSESTPSLAEMTMPKAASSVTSPERANGRNFTPLPEQSLKDLEVQALRDTEKDMNLALAKAGAKSATAETPSSASASSKPPPPPETPPPFTASQLADARAELQQAKNSGQGTAADHAEVDQALKNMEKQLGLTTEKAVAPKVAPVEKRVSSNVAAIKPEAVAKPPTETKVDSGTKQSLLSKIKNLAEKIFSIPLAMWHYLTAWIMK